MKLAIVSCVLATTWIGCKAKPAPGAGGSAPVTVVGSGSAAGSGSAMPEVGSAVAGSGSADLATGSGSAVDGSAAQVDGPDNLSTAGFGGLSLGIKAKAVVKLLGEPTKKGEIEEEGATGLWISQWEWPAKGVTLAMGAGTKTDAPTINSITLTAPSTLKNPKGIGIGSPRADVIAAFGKEVDQSASNASEVLVGSVYGGVFFDLANGKVSKIFVGAGAE